MSLARSTLRSALAVLIGWPLAAQQPTDTLRVRPDTVFALSPIVVTASRLPTRPERLGFALTVVRPRPRSSPWPADLVQKGPGAFLDQAAGPGGPAIVRLRGGEEVFTQILVDGVQVNQNGGFFDFQGFGLSNLADVQIARGPQSAVYGSSAVSGVVHFTTPRGEPGAPVVSVRGEGGGATEHGGSWRGAGTVRGGTPTFRYSAGVGSAYSRGVYAVAHDTRTDDGSVRLDWAPSPGWETTLLARRIEMSSNLPVRDPGATRVPLDPNARNDRDRTVASVAIRRASESREHHLKVSTYRESFRYEDRFDGIAPPVEAGFFVFDANLLFTSHLDRVSAELGGSSQAGVFALAYGGALEREALEDRVSGDFGGDPLLLDRSSVAGFGELAWRPTDALALTGGVRVEKYEALDAEATPRASLRWSPVEGRLSLRLAAGRAYKAPNLQQQYVDNPFIVANPELRAERSSSIEMGVDVSSPGGDRSLGVTVFRQRFDDLIRTVGIENDSRQINRNLGASRATGLEWEAGMALAGPWKVATSGTWLRTEVLDNVGLSPSEFPIGEALPFRPKVVGTLSLEYDDDVVGASLDVRRIGSQIVLSERFSGRRVALDPYTLVGVSGRWTVREGLSLFVRAENLLDTEYATAFDRHGIPATGTAGFEIVF